MKVDDCTAQPVTEPHITLHTINECGGESKLCWQLGAMMPGST